MQYDWEKLGFRKVEEADDNADGYMNPEKMPAFFKKIYKLIHKSTDGEVTPDELIAANHNSAVPTRSRMSWPDTRANGRGKLTRRSGT